MILRTGLFVLLLAALLTPLLAQTQASKSVAPKNQSPGELVDRVGNTGFVQIHAESFRDLTPKEKELAYWLTQAAIAIDPNHLRPAFVVWTAAEAFAGRDCLASARASIRRR